MVPLPLAFNVTDDPEMFALTVIPAFVPACRVRAPLGSMVLPVLTVMIPPELAVSVRLNIAPVDAPAIVVAARIRYIHIACCVRYKIWRTGKDFCSACTDSPAA